MQMQVLSYPRFPEVDIGIEIDVHLKFLKLLLPIAFQEDTNA